MAIVFRVSLPPISAPDVVSRKLTVKIGEEDEQVVIINVKESPDDPTRQWNGPQGATVSVSLIDIDDAGNESPASFATGVLQDVFAPPQPGALGIVSVDEVFEEPPAEEPPAEEPPAEEPPAE